MKCYECASTSLLAMNYQDSCNEVDNCDYCKVGNDSPVNVCKVKQMFIRLNVEPTII